MHGRCQLIVFLLFLVTQIRIYAIDGVESTALITGAAMGTMDDAQGGGNISPMKQLEGSYCSINESVSFEMHAPFPVTEWAAALGLGWWARQQVREVIVARMNFTLALANTRVATYLGEAALGSQARDFRRACEDTFPAGVAGVEGVAVGVRGGSSDDSDSVSGGGGWQPSSLRCAWGRPQDCVELGVHAGLVAGESRELVVEFCVESLLRQHWALVAARCFPRASDIREGKQAKALTEAALAIEKRAVPSVEKAAAAVRADPDPDSVGAASTRRMTDERPAVSSEAGLRLAGLGPASPGLRVALCFYGLLHRALPHTLPSLLRIVADLEAAGMRVACFYHTLLLDQPEAVRTPSLPHHHHQHHTHTPCILPATLPLHPCTLHYLLLRLRQNRFQSWLVEESG